MFEQKVIYKGSETTEPKPYSLRAGPLTLLFEPGEGFIRYIRYGRKEVLRGIYAAVRDHNWGTVSPQLNNLKVEIVGETFRVTFEADCIENDIDFYWKGTIEGDKNGTLVYRMDGKARSTFRRNRIGFCILHPMECAGSPCRIEKADGTTSAGTFPETISPHQPFKNLKAISHEIVPGVTAEVRFEGDIFEMEDQRNWTDASYKTYCTPLELPFPVEILEGIKIHQSVTLALKSPTTTDSTAGEKTLPGIRIRVGEDTPTRIPPIGLGTASHREPLSRSELARIAAMNLNHLRVDLHLGDDGYLETLKQGSSEAKATGTTLEIAFHLTNTCEEHLKTCLEYLKQAGSVVDSYLLFHQEEKSTSKQWIEFAQRIIREYFPDAAIVSGTDAFFTELNRERPPTEVLDGVCFSINPQVHAFDNASLTETLAAQQTVVESAKAFADGLPVTVSPVTLKPRFNPNATGPEPEPAPGELPPQVDVRQMSLYGAAWTLGSIKYLSRGGTGRITYYETTGWRGVMETESGSPLPEKFQSIPGTVYPLYHVLADVGEFAGGTVIPSYSSDPLQVDVLVLAKDDKIRILIANFTDCPRHVLLEYAQLSEMVRVKHLNEMNAKKACCSPEEYRSDLGLLMQTNRKWLEISLLPYATAMLDLEDNKK